MTAIILFMCNNVSLLQVTLIRAGEAAMTTWIAHEQRFVEKKIQGLADAIIGVALVSRLRTRIC